jgi:hypothetical protein
VAAAVAALLPPVPLLRLLGLFEPLLLALLGSLGEVAAAAAAAAGGAVAMTEGLCSLAMRVPCWCTVVSASTYLYKRFVQTQ